MRYAAPDRPVSSSSCPVSATRGCREHRFQALILAVMGLLQRERRVTYRRLQYVFRLDEACLEEVRQELLFTQVACDAQGAGLVWTGEGPPPVQPPGAMRGPSAPADTTAAPLPRSPPLRHPSPSLLRQLPDRQHRQRPRSQTPRRTSQPSSQNPPVAPQRPNAGN